MTVVQEAVAAVECSSAAQLTPGLICSSLRSTEEHVQQYGISQQGIWHTLAAHRGFITSTGSHGSVVSFPLAQTGEGISECELMQWFVKVGALRCSPYWQHLHQALSLPVTGLGLWWGATRGYCTAALGQAWWLGSYGGPSSCAVCGVTCRRVMWLTSSSPSVRYRATRQQ